MLQGPTVRYYRSFDLIRLPYPLKYAFRDACHEPFPFIFMINRLFVIQVDTAHGIKTILVSPSDVHANRRTPFFNRLKDGWGFFSETIEKHVAPIFNTVESCLASIAIRPEQVDFITYDHLHTQDLRRWLGDGISPGYLPRAKLLVTTKEWESVHALVAPQRDWYCPDGTLGIPKNRVITFDGDVWVGDGLALISTPGHTEGNHSIVAHTNDGIVVTSENGVAADSYQPQKSRIPGLRSYALETGMEVVLNGNTLERGLEQYISMMQERTIAGLAKNYPSYYNVVPSSELCPTWLSPRIKPEVTFGELSYGQPVS